MKKVIIFIAIFMSQLLFTQHPNHNIVNLPSPYCDLELLPEHWNGWFRNQNQLDQLFKRVEPKIVIELGAFLGLSTEYMAKRLVPGGKLYAVDHWSLMQKNNNLNAQSTTIFDLYDSCGFAIFPFLYNGPKNLSHLLS